MQKKIKDTNLSLHRGDITKQEVDAIVNAANSGLRGGGGVDGAIHRAGGPAIMEECNRIRQMDGGCPPGRAVITGGGNLKAQYVIHAVGPIYRDGQANEEDILRQAYLSCLKLAAEYNLRSIAFPSISTGAYGFPVDKAARIALGEVAIFCQEVTSLQDVRFVLFDEFTFNAFAEALTPLQ
jgi:O-acetyl-ADP-ribose deacetylase (regulator of RNase III)